MWNTRATDPLLEEMAEALDETTKILKEQYDHGLLNSRADIIQLREALKALQEYRERKDAK